MQIRQPEIWVKELHVMELPKPEEEGNKLASYKIDFHQLPSPPIQLMFLRRK